MKMSEPFKSALPVLEEIEKAGYEASFVGGSVRDLLLGKEIHDVDIATSATPAEVKSIFTRTIDVGIEHGTVIVLYDSNQFEVTSYRTETKYEDYRRPSEVVFIRSLKEDLARRDFTINAMAMNKVGEIYDPFDGKLDIQARIIRTVGNPGDRFSEDALRMLRAIRFMSQLSFQLDPRTEAALREHSHLLTFISVERILMELDKLVKGENYAAAIQSFVRSEMYRFLPELEGAYDSLLEISRLALSELTVDEIWALFLYLYRKDLILQKKILMAFRFSNKRMQWIMSINKGLAFRLNNHWDECSLYLHGLEVATSVEKIKACLMNTEAKQEVEKLKDWYGRLPLKERSDLNVTGNDVMKWLDRSGGPWLKELLGQIETRVLRQELPNRPDEIEKWVKSCNLN